MTYENGCLLALLIAVVKMVVYFAQITSVRAKNFAKVGLYYNPFLGNFEKDRRNTPGRVAVVVFWFLIFTPLFSWLTVASAVYSFIANKVRGQNALPERVKELQFKLSSAELPKEAIEEICLELARVAGVHAARVDLRTNADEDPNAIVAYDEDSSWRLDLDRKRKRYEIRSRVDTSVRNSICEYKIEGNKVFCRVIEERHEDVGEEKTVILNGIVQEDQIRADHAKSSFHFKKIEDLLRDYAKSVEWSEITSAKLRFFILARSPDQFPEARLNELVFAEIDRLTKGAQEFRKRCLGMGLVPAKAKDGEEEFRYPDGFPEETRASVEAFFENCASIIGVTAYEVANYKKITKDIQSAVGMPYTIAG